MEIDDVETPAELSAALEQLIDEHGLTRRAIEAATGIKGGTLSDIFSGRTELPRFGTIEAIVGKACGGTAADVAAWRRAHQRAATGGVGVALTVELDPVEFGVHKAITIDDDDPAVQALTVYVPRAHDGQLAQVVAAAAGGTSAMVVLVGGSSTGKTRALWEALAPLREQGGWRLWHPSSPTRRAALDDLRRVRARTVVWLNDTQEYLGGDGRPGDEHAAVALRELLRDRRHAPVLVVGTLWRDYYTALRAPHASQARELLDTATVLEVPDSFADADPDLLAAAAASDPRMRLAQQRTEDGQLTQYLAGGPEQLRRYRFELSAAAKAIVEVAMDARRMGHDNAIPHMFLETGAYAYMSDSDWQRATAHSDWFERALAETARPCKGADGPLTRNQPPPLRSRTHRPTTPSPHRGEPTAVPLPTYRLADYLDQHSRHTQCEQIPPIRFWEAAAAYTDAQHQYIFAHAARKRGLYRDAAQLWKNATAQEILDAGQSLVSHLHALFPEDPRPAIWTVTNVTLNEPGRVGMLLGQLREAGAHEQVQALLDRDPATNILLDDSGGVALLLGQLREAGAHEQVQALLDRDPATNVTFDNHPYSDAYGVHMLLEELRKSGAHEQLQALLDRHPATKVDPDRFNTELALLLDQFTPDDPYGPDLAAVQVAGDWGAQPGADAGFTGRCRHHPRRPARGGLAAGAVPPGRGARTTAGAAGPRPRHRSHARPTRVQREASPTAAAPVPRGWGARTSADAGFTGRCRHHPRPPVLGGHVAEGVAQGRGARTSAGAAGPRPRHQYPPQGPARGGAASGPVAQGRGARTSADAVCTGRLPRPRRFSHIRGGRAYERIAAG
ncbi:hypothetical protein [Nocardia asiatica]|uniref:hypothetical protein n=1 Tax=Nocardia asiatica TaxID=209252 RepID=UPI00245432F2|nr:hypothetical protein [Nocardia asiatica]